MPLFISLNSFLLFIPVRPPAAIATLFASQRVTANTSLPDWTSRVAWLKVRGRPISTYVARIVAVQYLVFDFLVTIVSTFEIARALSLLCDCLIASVSALSESIPVVVDGGNGINGTPIGFEIGVVGLQICPLAGPAYANPPPPPPAVLSKN